MALQSSRQKYGSVEDLSKSSRVALLAASDANQNSADRSSFDFDPSLTLRRRERVHGGGGGRRWSNLVVVGVLAAGVMLGLTHAGYRLPKITKTSASGTTSPSLTAITPEAEGTLKAAGGAASREELEVAAVQLPSRQPKANKGVTAPRLQPPPLSPKHVPPKTSTPPQHNERDELPPFSFTALNFYHVRDGKPAQDYPWLRDVKLIEPHRETTLTVEDPRDGFDYRWTIYQQQGTAEAAAGEMVEASGVNAIVSLAKLDDHVVVLEEMDADGRCFRRLEERVMVKYVRREIRTLTDEEREELLDAMYTLWAVRVDGGNGRELYGEDYADIYAINRLHYKAASDLFCDHFHDGLGFLTNHAVISNTFEYSLQRVNPKLTLPYWDFTIETSSAGGSGVGSSTDESQANSEIFQESWFGSVDPSDDMVKDGRWAYTPVPLVRTNDPGEVEPDVYGSLRAPWNVNGRPYLTRGMGKMCGGRVDKAFPWPTCEMHYSMVADYSDFYSWVWHSLYDPHGPVHIWIGGVLDCEETYAHIASLVGPGIADQLAMYSFIHRKNLYRQGFFSCTGTTSIYQAPADVMSSGQCGCQGFDLSQGDDYTAIFETLYARDLLIDFDDDTKRQVIQALCTGTVNDGDHLQASSSMDPSFYATHPTMERLWMYSVLTGHVQDFSWPDSDVTVTEPDGTESSEVVSLYGETCRGHRGSDVFPFGLLDTDVDGFEIKTGVKGMATGNSLTNRELLQALDPRSNLLSYVYDTFKWTHCDADGYDFDDAWETVANASKKKENHRTRFKGGVPRVPSYGVFERRRAARAAKNGT